jgi:indoleacetamide hydrolase
MAEGTAAAVAARIVPAGLGSDTTGSIRMPAHFCGIVGLRPSNPKANKTYPFEGIVPLQLDFDVAGPMARNVADVALIHSAVTHQAEIAPADLRGVRIGLPRAYFWETLDGDVAKIAETTLDKLRGAGAVLVDVDFGDLIRAALAVRAPLRPEGFRTDLAAFLAREYPMMTMKDAIPTIVSKHVRAIEADAWDHPPSREDVEKARSSMDALSTQYPNAFRQWNIVAIAYPTMPCNPCVRYDVSPISQAAHPLRTFKIFPLPMSVVRQFEAERSRNLRVEWWRIGGLCSRCVQCHLAPLPRAH